MQTLINASPRHKNVPLLCNFHPVLRPQQWTELPSTLKLSTKMAKITGLLATPGAEPAATTEYDSYVENLVSRQILAPCWVRNATMLWSLTWLLGIVQWDGWVSVWNIKEP